MKKNGQKINEDSEEENSDSEEKNNDNSTEENNTDDRSGNSDASMIDETEGNGSEVEKGELNKMDQIKRKAMNQSKNKNNKNNYHNYDVERKEQKKLVKILQTRDNYQSRQQKGSITFESGRGRGEKRGGTTNQSTNQHTTSNTIWNSEPTPPPLAQKDQIRHLKLRFNPKEMVTKRISVPKIIEDTCKSIYKKTGNKAIFFATSKIQLPSLPIKNIYTDFPSTKAELQIIF